MHYTFLIETWWNLLKTRLALHTKRFVITSGWYLSPIYRLLATSTIEPQLNMSHLQAAGHLHDRVAA